MFCRKCGKPMEAGASFCVRCGERVQMNWSDRRDLEWGMIPFSEELRGNFTLLLPAVLYLICIAAMYFVTEANETEAIGFVTAGCGLALFAYMGVLAFVAARRTLLFTCLYLVPYLLGTFIFPILIAGDMDSMLEDPSDIVGFFGLLVFPVMAALLIFLFQIVLTSRLQVVTDILAPLIVSGLFVVLLYLCNTLAARELAEKMAEMGVEMEPDETFELWSYAIYIFIIALFDVMLHLRNKSAAPALTCTVCGKANVIGSRYCVGCGTSFRGEPSPSVVCVGCGAIIPEISKFCMDCGAAVVPPKPVCSVCGAEMAAGARFCGQCGSVYTHV